MLERPLNMVAQVPRTVLESTVLESAVRLQTHVFACPVPVAVFNPGTTYLQVKTRI